MTLSQQSFNFQPLTARLFLIATSFPALSILTILLDKQLMKSFENINILIKVKLFCWEKNFFQKSFNMEKDCHLKEKNFFEKNVFLKKLYYLKKNFIILKLLS